MGGAIIGRSYDACDWLLTYSLSTGVTNVARRRAGVCDCVCVCVSVWRCVRKNGGVLTVYKRLCERVSVSGCVLLCPGVGERVWRAVIVSIAVI